MTRQWTLELGPAEWRARQRLESGFEALHVWRPHWSALLPGDHVAARLTSMRGALDIAGEEAVLSPMPPGLHEGQLLAVEITRARLPEPGRWKPARARALAERPQTLPPPAALEARWLALIGAPADAPRARVDADFVPELAFDGGSLSIERTRAGLVVDVDATVPALEAGLKAAATLARALCRVQAGGAVLVDFPGLADKAQRHRLAQAFDAASAADPRAFERTAINGFGLMQIIRPRLMPSLIDITLGTALRPSAETAAVALLRQLPETGGAGPRMICAPAAIIAAFAPLDAALAAASRQIGAPVTLETVPDAGQGHIHVAHP